jgi:diguanylate cyclase (GGDEF)-like protein
LIASFFSIGIKYLWASSYKNMRSILGFHSDRPRSSPLEGLPVFRSQQAESELRQLGRREWWLWLSAFFVTVLSAFAFLLSSFRSLFPHSAHFYEIRPDQARWGVMCLLLLFNGWLLYRQWTFRRERRQLTQQNTDTQSPSDLPASPSGLDPATGLFTRTSIEQQLGKEIARARRQNTSLSVATIHLEDFAELTERYGLSAMDQVIKETARRLKKACRGSDFAVRLTNDDFLLVLPECSLGEVQKVLNRLGSLVVECSGRKVELSCTTGWVDYQPGDLPSDLLKRATQILHLYENAAKESFSATLTTR